MAVEVKTAAQVESNPTYLRRSCGCDSWAFFLLFELHIIYSFQRNAAEKERPLLLEVSHIFLRVRDKEPEEELNFSGPNKYRIKKSQQKREQL